jgi:predicted enzyme related to lactoylglutathione lyase
MCREVIMPTDRPFRITGIDRSDYMAKDPSRAIAFYRDVLGLELQSLAPDNDGGEFELPDGSTFGLWVGSDATTPFQPSNGVLFAVDDLEAALSSLETRGITIVTRLETPVCSMALINDSEGNIVTLHKRKSVAPTK